MYTVQYSTEYSTVKCTIQYCTLQFPPFLLWRKIFTVGTATSRYRRWRLRHRVSRTVSLLTVQCLLFPRPLLLQYRTASHFLFFSFPFAPFFFLFSLCVCFICSVSVEQRGPSQPVVRSRSQTTTPVPPALSSALLQGAPMGCPAGDLQVSSDSKQGDSTVLHLYCW